MGTEHGMLEWGEGGLCDGASRDVGMTCGWDADVCGWGAGMQHG